MDITGVVAAVRGRIMVLIWVVRELVGSGFLTCCGPTSTPDGAGHVPARRCVAGQRHRPGTARNPGGIAIIDEAGPVTWGELDRRADALAAALAAMPRASTVAVMCRNHRGLVESIAAVSRLGADSVLLNTGFAAPQLADVLERENVDVLIADDEFDGLLGPAVQRLPGLTVVRAWIEIDADVAGTDSLDGLIEAHWGHRAKRPARQVASCCSPRVPPARRRERAAAAAPTSVAGRDVRTYPVWRAGSRR